MVGVSGFAGVVAATSVEGSAVSYRFLQDLRKRRDFILDLAHSMGKGTMPSDSSRVDAGWDVPNIANTRS